MGGSQQYAGNRGYDDDPRRVYRYDSNVANHRNVARGDLVLIRDRERLLGIAQIEQITSAPGKKTILRCPECSATDLKQRKLKLPKFRCGRGHEFDTPMEDLTDVTVFAAHYENTFVDATDAVSVAEIKAAALRPNDQLSIEEIDIRKIERRIMAAFPETRTILAHFFQQEGLGQLDAAEEAPLPAPPKGTSTQQDSYVSSLADTRALILRSIRERRGQSTFRQSLLKRYGARCLVTGCDLPDVLEAAHIWPYRGEGDNHPENGLLLRADIHTLFDLDLLAIEPASMQVAIAPTLQRVAEYAALRGRPLLVSPGVRPAVEPLARRWMVFTSKWA